MPLTSTYEFSIASNLTKTTDFGSPSSQIGYQKMVQLASGIAAGQADVIWSDAIAIGISATSTIDLANASFVDAFGVAITIARVKCIAIYSAAANTVAITISRPATNGLPIFGAASGSTQLFPGGWFFWFAGNANFGIPVTAGTGDLLDLVNGAAASNVDVFISGTSA